MYNEENEITNKRNLIIAGGVFFVVCIIFISTILSNISSNVYNVEISNEALTDDILSSSDFDRLKSGLRTTLSAYYEVSDNETIELTIRKASYSEKTVGNGTQAEFIIDIPTAEVTYSVWMKKNSDSIFDINFSCVAPDMSSYPDNFCIGTDGFSTIDVTLDKFLPYQGTTKSGIAYTLSHDAYDPTLRVSANSCGDEDIISAVRDDVEKWITEKGYNATIFPIEIPADNCDESLSD